MQPSPAAAPPASPNTVTRETTVPGFRSECGATFRLAFPLVSGQLSQMLMGVVDTVMVGAIGIAALGASTFANTLLVVPLVLGIGVLSSVSVRVSQSYGADNPTGTANAIRHGTWLALGLGLLIVLIITAGLPLLPLLGQPPEVVERTPGFLLICAVSLIPALLTMTWKNHADALNRPWVPFWINLSAVGVNAGLNYLWIHGLAGFPAMGLNGAALATLTARLMAALAMLIWLRRSAALRPWTPRRWFVSCRLNEFRSLLRIGVPAGLQLLAEVVAFAVSALMIGTLGTIPLAAHQVAMTCASTAFMVPLGIAMATTVRVGEIVGARQTRRLRRVIAAGWLFAVVFMGLSMGVFLLAGEKLAGLFVADPQVVRMVASLLVVAGFFQLVDGLQVVSAGALRGMNDVRIPAWIAFTSYLAIALPVGALLGLPRWAGYGAAGVWAGLATGLSVAAVLLGSRAWRMAGQAGK
ncbi:MAG: MATE family efflux transporter [Verrucomicrobiaceae bacterium]|nr:MAG: MATE family efflux transporter [Verrucomicrobiaceae bacterium]